MHLQQGGNGAWVRCNGAISNRGSWPAPSPDRGTMAIVSFSSGARTTCVEQPRDTSKYRHNGFADAVQCSGSFHPGLAPGKGSPANSSQDKVVLVTGGALPNYPDCLRQSRTDYFQVQRASAA